MLDFNELHTLMILNGGQRLAHLEEEIFADSRDTVVWYYLKMLIDGFGVGSRYSAWQTPIECRHDAERVIFFYSIEILGDRWMEAEAVFDPTRYWTKRYRQHHKLESV